MRLTSRWLLVGALALAPVAAAAGLAATPAVPQGTPTVPWCCAVRGTAQEKPALPTTPSYRLTTAALAGRRLRRGRVSGPARRSAPPTMCLHCGASLSTPLVREVAGQDFRFCSEACHQAASDYFAAGLGHLYAQGPQARQLDGTEAEAYAERAVTGAYVQHEADGAVVHLLVSGLHCGACVWILERAIARVAGVAEARVQLTTGRARVRFTGEVDLAAVMKAIARAGYAARPYDPGVAEAPMRGLHRFWLSRLAVAGFGAVATMFLAEPLYWSYEHTTGADQALWQVLRYLGMVVATATTAYTALPFWRGAVAGLARRQLGMDVLIMLGVAATYLASLWGFVTRGPVYFDSLTMFLFLIVLGRFAEAAVKGKVYASMEHLLGASAKTARLVRPDGTGLVPASTLAVGDLVELRPGDQVPADGTIEAGATRVDASMLTGESRPVARGVGDALTGGTLNLEGSVRMRVSRVGDDTTFAKLERLVNDTEPDATRIQRLADAAGHWGTLTVAVVAALTLAGWGVVDASRALSAAVAVLIITCPCALGLATPTAIVLAVSKALKLGILFKRAEALEDLPGIRHVVFDKTGTLTVGAPSVVATLGDEETVLPLAASLEAASEHPLGRAVVAYASSRGVTAAAPADFAAVPGQGVTGTLGGKRALAGKAAFLAASGLVAPAEWQAVAGDWVDAGHTVLWVAQGERVLGALALADRLRPDAAATVAALREAGLGVTLLTGDNRGAAAAIASALGIDDVEAEVLPAEKRDVVLRLKHRHGKVLMVGDGLNDAPALAAADVGVAIARGADLSVMAADVVLLGDRLGAVLDAKVLAERTFAVVRDNFRLSAVYNVIAIPLAVFGFVTPLLAAVLMPLSSLAVLANALRLRR